MTTTDPSAEAAVTAAFREEWGRVVATLIRRTGGWDLAEECAQEAFTEAARRWPQSGVPDSPGAWLTTVAGNRAVDRLRRQKRGSELLEQLARDPTDEAAAMRAAASAESDAMQAATDQEQGIEDDRLRLIFTCCHPALALEARVALTLRTLTGLTTAEIARAFLVPEATMSKRLTRAKAKIGAAGIPYRVPPLEVLPERLGGVLTVLYLLFNEGYLASSGDELIRRELCGEAIRLTRLLARLMPDETEVAGLLALMLMSDSRRDARVDGNGDLVTLEDQDRARWDRAEITEGVGLLNGALQGAGASPLGAGPYLLQAAISACHATADSAQATDWRQIEHLYGLLEVLIDTPVVRLNRAVAVAMSGDTATALQMVDQLAESGELDAYYLLPATRADLLRRSGDMSAAASVYRRALDMAPSQIERRYLARRLAEIEAGRLRRD